MILFMFRQNDDILVFVTNENVLGPVIHVYCKFPVGFSSKKG